MPYVWVEPEDAEPTQTDVDEAKRGWVTCAQATRIMNRSRSFVESHARTGGSIETNRVGNRIYYRLSDVERLAQSFGTDDVDRQIDEAKADCKWGRVAELERQKYGTINHYEYETSHDSMLVRSEFPTAIVRDDPKKPMENPLSRLMRKMGGKKP